MNIKERAEKMRLENAEVWKTVYEDFYNVPLRYNTKEEFIENKKEKSKE